MPGLRRIGSRLLGTEIRPPFGTLLVGNGFATGAGYLFTLFYGIWMLNVAGASTKAVSIAFLLSGVCNALGGVLGGGLSDRFGRRAVLGGASVLQLSAATVLLPSHPPIPLAVVAFALVSLAGGSGTAGDAAIADLAEDERQRSEYFSASRVIYNVGSTVAPVLGSVLILAGWWALHLMIVMMYTVAILSRFRLPPLRRDADMAESPFGNALDPLRDGRLRVFLLGAVAFGATYGAFEILLPISLTRDHGFAPAMWGALFVANPVVVILLQVRLTRWASRFSRSSILFCGSLAMAVPFLAISYFASIPVVLGVVAVFTIGEMLVFPTVSVLVSAIAPPGGQGTYQGLAWAGFPVGLALLPAVTLNVNRHFGETVMWSVVAALGFFAAAMFAVVDRASGTAQEEVEAGTAVTVES